MTSLMIIFWVVSGQTRVYAGLGHAGLAGGQGFSLHNKRLYTQIQESIILLLPRGGKKSAQGIEFKVYKEREGKKGGKDGKERKREKKRK